MELNTIHIQDIFNAIMILINNNIKPGSYFLKNPKNIKIKKLIENLNENLKKKIKVKYQKKTYKKIPKSNLKKIPMWNPNRQIIKKIESSLKK